MNFPNTSSLHWPDPNEKFDWKMKPPFPARVSTLWNIDDVHQEPFLSPWSCAAFVEGVQGVKFEILGCPDIEGRWNGIPAFILWAEKTSALRCLLPFL